MNILAIDTTSKNASVALSFGDIILENEKTEIKDHSVELISMIKEIMEKANANFDDIDVFAVSTGPGSFTGIRIGIATIKGMGFDEKSKAYEITSLEELALNGLEKANEKDIIISVIDAKNEQIYYGVYIKEGELLDKIVEKAGNLNELIDYIGNSENIINNNNKNNNKNQNNDSKNNKIYIVGDGYTKNYEFFKNNLEDKLYLEKIPDDMQHAKNIIVKIIKESNSSNFKNDKKEFLKQLKHPKDVLPNYLKKSQAQRELEKRKSKK